MRDVVQHVLMCCGVRHLPLWFPGAGFKRKAIQWKAKMQEFTDKPFELVKARMASVHSLVSAVRVG